MNPLFDQTVCLELRFRRPGVRRKVETSNITVDAEPEAIHVSKELLDSETYRKIVRLAGDLRRWLAARALPSPLRSGTYLVPLPMLEGICGHLESTRKLHDQRVMDFIEEYPVKVEEAKIRLRSLFDLTEYPAVESLASAFEMGWRLMEFGLPGQSKVSEYLYEKEKTKLAEEMENAAEEVKAALREAMLEYVSWMQERLEAAPDGKRRVLNQNKTEAFRAFLETFADRNVLGDEEMTKLVEQAKAVLGGKSIKDLRSGAAYRGQVKAVMDKAKVALESMLSERPRRAIDLEDE